MQKGLLTLGLLLSLLSLTSCDSTPSTSSAVTGAITISVPDTFPYNVSQTISVALSSNSVNTGLGFSNLTLSTNPRGSLSMLTIDPSSSCLSITANSTATSCTFTVTNNSSSGENTLNNSGYYVTGQLGGQTITSNVDHPGTEPPTTGAYWTINVNNTTGANQYLFVFGQDASGAYEVVVFDSNNYGTAHTYSSSTNYGSDENSIILTPGTHNIHIPYGIYGGRVYLSNAQMQGLELTSNGGIVTPSFTYDSGNNLNYNTIFDNFEFTYAADSTTQIPHAVVNQTQVDALGVPICINGTNNYSPITQAGFCDIDRTTLLNDVTTAFNAITDNSLKTQWLSTELLNSNDQSILRIMNPGSADAISGTSSITSFSSYLENYVNALGSSGVYSAADSLRVSLDGIAIISGNITGIIGNYTYNFTCSGGGCDGQSGSMPLTSKNLLTGAAPGGANDATTWAYEMVSSAFMAGQLPSTQQATSAVITQTYLRGLNPITFYQSNSVSDGNEYQYSVFSNALRNVQLDGTYTFAYNDVLGVSSTMTQTLTSSTDEPDPITVKVTY